VSRPTRSPSRGSSLVELVETPSSRNGSSGLVWAADPCLEGVLDRPRSQGRPSAAGYAGRFAVLDTGARREKKAPLTDPWVIVRAGRGGGHRG
jgi:hypothetical protein